MRRATKDPNSLILSKNLTYKINNSANNKKIADILYKEQKCYCAYTDEFISRTDASDIEHFNPTLKNTIADNYNNWFLVKTQWNKEKSEKWGDYQPVLHPTDPALEDRIIYYDGDYVVANLNDTEAKNLVRILKLDDPALAGKRKKYIDRKKEEITAFGGDAVTFFNVLLEADNCQISYLRAIKEVFKIDIWQLIP
ncbi:MAG: hypothetical protein JO154_19755 [Chitinophaga sp.]|uniref:HNH endonuclease domain-containing protein n=1 Tax=Chitinophaga sp. TaxID=1869181 RepID=UPI0025C1A4B0|nr:HNH endonuclease domain-containing protein [Chitinophaga sp.]MBV8254845.1 hypothetical protein [Chitinophaga sp.]